MLAHQGHHQQRHGAGGGRDHSRAAADEGDHHGDAKRSIETDARVDPGDDREGDGLGNQRQGDDEPGEYVAAHVGEPVLFDRVEHGEPEKRERVTQGWRRIAEHGGDCAGEARPIRGRGRMNSALQSRRRKRRAELVRTLARPIGRTNLALRVRTQMPANQPFWLNMASITKTRKTGMPTLANCYRVVLIVLLIFAGLLLSMYWAGWLAEQRTWAERSQEARGQLDLYAQTIHTQVERFRSVPALLALDSDIRKLLENPGDRQLRNQLNRRLERQNQAAGSSVLYLIDRQGNTLAASNWREWSSFVGYNYGFRPYFRDALTQDSGRYFAVGVTTGIP